MKVNIAVDENNRLVMTTEYPLDETKPIYEIPDDIQNIGDYVLQDDKLVYQPLPKSNDEQIFLLKQNLKDTDYVILKIAEGVATTEEYADVIAQRQEWRKQINELESKE